MKLSDTVSYRSLSGALLAVLSLVTLLTLISPTSFAATAPSSASSRTTGNISGRVQNIINGQYLTNARVSVQGTKIETFTDETGIFHLTQVPSGSAVLQVYYTGLDAKNVPVTVPVGGTVEKAVALTQAARYGAADEVTTLDPFTVSASNELSADALAVNEQRFAPNIKSVVSAEAFGDIAEGNVGEFLKFMPGVSADFADPDIVSISVRGLASNLTQVTSDGAQVASAHYGGSTRVFQFNQVSINNISRIELTKVPRPSDPADSMGGIVNMVSKSAFERKNARLDYRVYLGGGKGNLTTKKMPDGFDKDRYRVLPNADFSYTLPINDKLGFVLTGLTSNRFDERHVIARTYIAKLKNTSASYSDPIMQKLTVQEMPRYTYRTSYSLKGDWRVTPNSVLSASFQRSEYESSRALNQLLAHVGGTATPTFGGTPLDYSPDYTHGATGRGAMTLNGSVYHINGATNLGSVRYRFDNGTWQIKAGASKSTSKTRFTDTEDGTFYTTTSQLFGGFGFVGSPFTISFDGLDDVGGGGIMTITDKNDEPVDWHNLKNYRLTAAFSQPRDVKDEVSTLNFSIRRRLHSLPFPLAIEVGGAQRTQVRDTLLQKLIWDYDGLDAKRTTWESPLPYATEYPEGDRPLDFGFSNVPWVSNQKAYAAWQNNPILFNETEKRSVAREKYRIDNSEVFDEKVTAGYVEVDMRLWQNRVRILAGVRYERTLGKGQGALIDLNNVFVKDADGSFAHDGNGKLMRKPEAGAKGSMDELRQTRFERGARASRVYDGYYPSLNTTFSFTNNLMLRAAYAKTYGRPNFKEIIPRATINDYDADGNDPDALLGAINVRNPALKPWVANNFDFSLEYYTDTGGAFSVGVYRKEIDGFFQREVKFATAEDIAELDMDPKYIGYQLTTVYNLGSGRAQGVELSLKQPLEILGPWGRHFDVFANTSFFTAISGLRGRSINAGLTYRQKPFTVGLRMNHRTGSRGTKVAALGPDAYQYEGTRTTVNLSLGMTLTRHLSLFVNGSNIFNDNPSAERYGSDTPKYARFFRVQKFGAQYSLGIKGTF